MISILTPGAVAPSIALPTTVHHAADNEASLNGWLESLLSSAKKALPAQPALASPRPTASPDPFIVSRTLLNRQAVQTCGWVNANISLPVTCSAGLTCASNTINSVHYCCEDGQNCTIPTTCLDSTAATASCGSICQSDPCTLKCTFTDLPFCYTRFWNETPPLSGFGCAPSPFTQTVYTTYELEDEDTTESVSASNGGSSIGSVSSNATSLSLSSTSQSSHGASISTAEASTTGSSREPSSTLSLLSSSTTESGFASISGTSSPTAQSNPATLTHGAIAGIAVGGFFALILLLTLGGLIHRKCFRPKPPPSTKVGTFGPGKSQVVNDGRIISGLENLGPPDSVSQYHFRSDSSTVVSPSATYQNLIPREERHRTPSPAHPASPPSMTSWEPSIPPARR